MISDKIFPFPAFWGFNEMYQVGKMLELIADHGYSISRHVRDYTGLLKSDLLSFFLSDDGIVYLISEESSHALILQAKNNGSDYIDTVFTCPECGHSGNIFEFEKSDCKECQSLFQQYNFIVNMYEN